MKSVDILVAVRNEAANVTEFVTKINELIPKEVDINVIFLEDGSTDGTVEILMNLSKNFKNINYISLENKYGQYAALSYGLSISNADATITMDVDGGHPIETAIEMINLYLEGNNLVQGHRIVYKRKKFYRTIMSYTFNLFYYLFVGVNFFQQNVMFRLMDKKTKEKFLKNKNWWHIFKTNFKNKDGIKCIYIEYTAPEREFGESKYDFFRLLKLSYKSFFALLSLKRLLFINLILIALIYFITLYIPLVFSTLVIGILLLINITFYLTLRNYPIAKLRIIETSITRLKK